MRPVSTIISVVLIGIFASAANIVHAEQKGTPIYGRTDPSKYKERKNVHEGAGSMSYMELLGSDTFESNNVA